MPHEAGHTQDQEVTVGAAVFTRDNDHIGTVKELRGGYFKVDARMQPDFWLQREFIESCSADRITMQFDKDVLGDYKVEDPEERYRAADMGAAGPGEGGRGPFPENPASATIRSVEQRGG